jgi:hypothetical protein
MTQKLPTAEIPAGTDRDDSGIVRKGDRKAPDQPRSVASSQLRTDTNTRNHHRPPQGPIFSTLLGLTAGLIGR